jgi:hypothetical protein
LKLALGVIIPYDIEVELKVGQLIEADVIEDHSLGR